MPTVLSLNSLPAVLLASSRTDGNTRALAEMAFPSGGADYVDLNAMNTGFYDYENRNADDDFLPLIERIITREIWVLATPLYWYTMSAQAKTFIDRLSDLLTPKNTDGYRLKGKRFAVVCSGTDRAPPKSFDEPFALTCAYLGMNYCGSFYAQFDGRKLVNADVSKAAAEFGASVVKARNM